MKGTIFVDLDGTLIDTSERHYRVYKDILDSYEMGIENTISKDEFWNSKRRGKKTVEILLDSSPKGFSQKFESEWIKRIEKKENLKYDVLMPGVLDILSLLQDRKNKLILVTLRNNRENLLCELNNLRLANYFEEILVDSPMKLKNKAPLIKNYIERHSREDKFIIVGDTEADTSAGKKLGILTVAVTYGIRSEDFLTKLKPDFCLNNLSELPEILKGIGDDT